MPKVKASLQGSLSSSGLLKEVHIRSSSRQILMKMEHPIRERQFLQTVF